jgi:hypothetical protein
MDFGALRHITSLDGHYEAIPQPMPFQQARQYCQMHDYDLASVHSAQEQQLATDQVWFVYTLSLSWLLLSRLRALTRVVWTAQCAKLTQRGKSKASTECEHHLANGDNNMASNTWISQSEDFVYVGCFVSDGGSVDGGVTPWPDGSGNWKTLNWAQCKDAARAAGLNSFAMEGSQGYDNFIFLW